MTFEQVGEEEGVYGLKEVIFSLRYRHKMDVDRLLNYYNQNDSLMESPTDEEII